MSIVPRYLSSAVRLYKEWVVPLILLPKEMAIRFDPKERPGIDHLFANRLPTEEALNQAKLRAEESDEARMEGLDTSAQSRKLVKAYFVANHITHNLSEKVAAGRSH
ncbi:hypothetical protein MANI_021847 [Metarhizium anisopliae]|nr:hypothetical protein MANI_021847 [Metarhizium anisopliae]